MLNENRITAPTCPSRTRWSKLESGLVPDMPTMIRCPSSFAGEAGTDRAAVLAVPAAVVARLDRLPAPGSSNSSAPTDTASASNLIRLTARSRARGDLPLDFLRQTGL